jgi:hypothetical protein
VIEVGVTDDDGVGARRVRGDRPRIGDEARGDAAKERGAREVGIEEHRGALVLEGEAGGAEPAHADAVGARRGQLVVTEDGSKHAQSLAKSPPLR